MLAERTIRQKDASRHAAVEQARAAETQPDEVELLSTHSYAPVRVAVVAVCKLLLYVSLLVLNLWLWVSQPECGRSMPSARRGQMSDTNKDRADKYRKPKGRLAEDVYTLRQVAQCIDLPPYLVERLAKDEDWLVRGRIARWVDLPTELVETLAIRDKPRTSQKLSSSSLGGLPSYTTLRRR